MAEKTLSHVQERTKEGRLVVPLDHPRTFDYNNEVIGSGFTSGLVYTACSGRDVYIKHMIVTEYSGTDGMLRLNDASGEITPYIPIAANTCVTWDPRPAACGPLHKAGNNPLQVLWNTDAAFYGSITLIVQIDPQVEE